MIRVSEVKTTMPESYKTDLEKRVYETLTELEIPFFRVETDEAITMEDCEEIDKRLEVKTVKTLLLCNRQKTNYYLFVTRGDKPFSSKNFSEAMGCSRVSFAPADDLMNILQTKVGAASALSLIVDKTNRVTTVLDREILGNEYYGCSDGTTTGYMKIKTDDLVKKYLPACGHYPITVEV